MRYGGPLRVPYFGNKGWVQGIDTLVKAAVIAYSRGVSLKMKVVWGHGRLAILAAVMCAPTYAMEPVKPECAIDFYEWVGMLVASLRELGLFE